MRISLIANTGIQYCKIENFHIDFEAQVSKRLCFYEQRIENEIFLDPVYHFQINDVYVRRQDLISGGYLDKYSGEIEDETNINFDLLTCWDRENIIAINSLDSSLKGSKFEHPLDCLENQWLPIPFFEDYVEGLPDGPLNWCRLKLIPKLKGRNKRTYDVVLAFDTMTNEMSQIEYPFFDNNEVFKEYSICGFGANVEEKADAQQLNRINNMLIPLKIYEYCSSNNNWFNSAIEQAIHGEAFDISGLPEGQRLKYLSYYIYFIYYLQQSKILPTINLYSDKNNEPINVNLVLDIGNSRTFGLLAEDPLDESFSKAETLYLTDLDSGKIHKDPFDMRLAFREEHFGSSNIINSSQFKWPSILAIGEEAQKYIYKDRGSYNNIDDSNTYYSSPKRFLWDQYPYKGQWEFAQIDKKETGACYRSRTIWMEGISQQFHSDGSLALDPTNLGAKSSYSRQSLMTFTYIEILLQAQMQINSYPFRSDHGQESRPRKISRIIISSPTAMPKSEQITLRRCAEEATIVLKRFYENSYTIPYVSSKKSSGCDIIPSVKDLSLPANNSEDRKSWGYDEASCCQMVFLYSELKRYLGNSEELFRLYGKIRKDIPSTQHDSLKPSLTIGSIDIGAGTTDMMICTYNYSNRGDSTITPIPMFWDSFYFAGDDLVKAIISQVIIEDFGERNEIGCSGVIANQLKQMGYKNIPTLLHQFFNDTSSMTNKGRKMRRDFNVQISIPIAHKLLELLQEGSEDTVLTFEDIFAENKPVIELLDYFYEHFGFRFEELNWKFSTTHLNDIIRKVFEPHIRKWSAMLYTYGCDIVLLGGRPAALQQIYDLFLKLYAVSPNRLISMNKYRVGSWYPGSDGVGYFGDRKSLVATGALISYLAENGKLNAFKLKSNLLKEKILPTAEYLGLYNSYTGEIQNIFFEPDLNRATISVESFPIFIGCKQLNVAGYPSRVLYSLDFNDEKMREIVASRCETQEQISSTVELIKHRVKAHMPLKLIISRAYKEDKERIEIESIVNNEREDISPQYFKLKAQSIVEDSCDWLDSGRFVLKIGSNNNR